MRIKVIAKIIFILGLLVSFSSSAVTYMSKKEFIKQAFSTNASSSATKPKAQSLWLNEDVQKKITQILDHKYAKIRIKYWQQGGRTVWFLDKIGKERPISFGICIENDRIQLIKVLAFRESRGGEIRMQAFTEQFSQIGLNENSKLDQSIDGITGATMSVSAMKKISRMALMLARIVNQ